MRTFCSVPVPGDRLLSLQTGYRFFKPGGLFGIKQSEESYAEGQQMQEDSKILVSPCAGECTLQPGAACSTTGKLPMVGGEMSSCGQRLFRASLQPFWAILAQLAALWGRYAAFFYQFGASLGASMWLSGAGLQSF